MNIRSQYNIIIRELICKRSRIILYLRIHVPTKNKTTAIKNISLK